MRLPALRILNDCSPLSQSVKVPIMAEQDMTIAAAREAFGEAGSCFGQRQKPRSLVRPGFGNQQKIGRVRETCGQVALLAACHEGRSGAFTCTENSCYSNLMNGALVDLYRCPASFVTSPPTLSCLVQSCQTE